jgi:FkbM family methyltransferase
MSVPESSAYNPAEEAKTSEDARQRQVREFLELFTPRAPGFFAEVGACHPWSGSPTWHLEQRGWRGILVEPLPDHADRLREERTAAVFAVACSSPANAGRMLPFHAGSEAAAGPEMTPEMTGEMINVPARTLDSLLEEAGAPRPLDFLSVDVDGHEIEVLRGFNFARWSPRLILLEDRTADPGRHRFMKANGYRRVRRTGRNGWYVPADAPVGLGLGEHLRGLWQRLFHAP